MSGLHPYQLDVIEKWRRIIAEDKYCRVIIVMPTGSGKTHVATAIIQERRAAGERVLVLAHTREIVGQTSEKLLAHGIDHGLIQAGQTPELGKQVQVASIQTLWSWAMRTRRILLPPADLLVIDECQHAPAWSWQKIIASYPNAPLIGLTATPCRADGRGLGGIFNAIVESPQVAELIEQKYLVKTRVYAPADPDLKGVHTRSGDYVETELAERMDRDNLVGDIVSHWHKFGGNRKTVCFAINVAHSLHIRDEFCRSGVKAEHIDGDTAARERSAILARLASGETQLVTNCLVLTEGWNLPAVDCCILARPTKKMGLFRQMVGRVLRTAPDKTSAIVLDHSGAVFRHGFVEDHVEWTLDPDKRAESPTHTQRVAAHPTLPLLECTNCGCIRVAGQPCAHCGFLPQRPPQAIVFREGDLALVDRQRRTAQPVSDPNERMRWYAELLWIEQERGYRRGYAKHKYREKFAAEPHGDLQPRKASPEVLAWVRSRNIAYAKAQEKARLGR
jgi:DNA repair protein RadD